MLGFQMPVLERCSVSSSSGAGFNDADLVKLKRMYIYLDPDFDSASKERFVWPHRTRNEW
jgi:hypothetical protein